MRGWCWTWMIAALVGASPSIGAPPATPPEAAASSAPSTTTPTTEPAPTTHPPRLALVGRTAESTIYIDKPTLARLTSDKYKLWAQVKQSSGDTVKLLLQINCTDRSYLVLSSANYDADGAVIDSYTPRSPSLQYIVPDSAAEYIHSAICKK